MSVIAGDLPGVQPRHRRLTRWIGRAWHTVGWRHIAMAVALSGLFAIGNPGGGTILPSPEELRMPWLHQIPFFALFGFPLVFAALVADQAIDDGAGALGAYLVAVIVAALITPAVSLKFASLMGWWDSDAGLGLFWVAAVMTHGGGGMGIYGYWRETQRSLRRLQATETQRLRDAQRLSASRLLAMQSRVEPQLLFDVLSLVRSRHERDPQGADALLAELITLLRAMLPSAESMSSNVEREFALASAYARVRSAQQAAPLAAGTPSGQLLASPEASVARLAPMIVLPLLRAVLAEPGQPRRAWSLQADVDAGRLKVVLTTSSGNGDMAVDPLARLDLASLRAQLHDIYGDDALLGIERPRGLAATMRLTLDLPFEHDDRADR